MRKQSLRMTSLEHKLEAAQYLSSLCLQWKDSSAKQGIISNLMGREKDKPRAIHHHAGFLQETRDPEPTPGTEMKESNSPTCLPIPST